MYYYFKNYKSNSSGGSGDSGSSRVLDWIDTNHIWAVGHSYGGITAAISVKQLLKETV